MKNSSSIAETMKRLFSKKQRMPNVSFMHPVRDWVLVLGAAGMLFILGSLCAGFFFWFELHAEAGSAPESDAAPEYKKDVVRTVLENYRLRKERFEALQGVQDSAPLRSQSSNESVVSEESLGAE